MEIIVIFLMGKTIQIHYNTMVLKGFAGCMRERKKVQKQTSTIVLQLISTLITNRCENDARESDAKIMENDSNNRLQRHPKSRKILQTYLKIKC